MTPEHLKSKQLYDQGIAALGALSSEDETKLVRFALRAISESGINVNFAENLKAEKWAVSFAAEWVNVFIALRESLLSHSEIVELRQKLQPNLPALSSLLMLVWLTTPFFSAVWEGLDSSDDAIKSLTERVKGYERNGLDNVASTYWDNEMGAWGGTLAEKEGYLSVRERYPSMK